MNLTKHKRVRQTEKDIFIFYPFGPHISRGFVTRDKSAVEKALAQERRISALGFALLIPLYVQFHDNKAWWVAAIYIAFAAAIFATLQFSAKSSLKTTEIYSPEEHGEILLHTT